MKDIRCVCNEVPMVADRNKQLRIVAEMLLVHLPVVLDNQPLARDLLTVVSLAIRAAAADAEESATAWDKRAYHLKADKLRREWKWAPGAANYAAGLAYRARPVTVADLEKLRALIGAPLERPKRLYYKNLAAFRGAREANRQREGREGRQIPKRSLV
jgi:hypothetical protein